MIAAAGPTSVSDEMTEPDKPPATHDISNWIADKYTPKMYIGAWKKVFKQYKKDFPGQYVSLSHGNDVPLPNPKMLAIRQRRIPRDRPSLTRAPRS